MKNGKYAVYKGNEYQIYNGVQDNKNVILLLSHNKVDLQSGFKLSYSEEYMQHRQFFTCEKKVPKSEITEAYEIITYAKYKGVSASIVGCSKENWIGLETCCLYGENEKEFLTKINIAGFKFITREQGGTNVYGIDVSLDEPELELVEERTEIDISKL